MEGAAVERPIAAARVVRVSFMVIIIVSVFCLEGCSLIAMLCEVLRTKRIIWVE